MAEFTPLREAPYGQSMITNPCAIRALLGDVYEIIEEVRVTPSDPWLFPQACRGARSIMRAREVAGTPYSAPPQATELSSGQRVLASIHDTAIRLPRADPVRRDGWH